MIAIRNNIKYRRAQISEVCGGKVKVGGGERIPHFDLVLPSAKHRFYYDLRMGKILLTISR